MTARTAVLFKAYMWNETIGRLFELCKAQCPRSDLYILYDNSRGQVDIPPDIMEHEKVIFMPFASAEEIGMIWGPDDSVYGGHWYNGDYHQNLFILNHPDYDYICPIESDVAVLNNLDEIFAAMAARDIDAVYQPYETANASWPHTAACAGYYDLDASINKGLICISFFSRRAAMRIALRRIEMAAQKRSSALRTWPIGEAVVAHEIVTAGLRCAPLSEFCDTMEQYDWAPAYLESELNEDKGRAFVHPVIPFAEKFIISNFVQCYNGLNSPEKIERGIALERARRINKFEVYARLFHVDHVWMHGHHRTAVFQAAQEGLSGPAGPMIAERNAADAHAISRQLNIDLTAAQRLVSDMPRYDTTTLSLKSGQILQLPLMNGATTIRVACTQPADLVLELNRVDGTWESRALRQEGVEGSLSFFVAFLSEGFRQATLRCSAARPAPINWLQISSGGQTL
jgi:hypothetical protein